MCTLCVSVLCYSCTWEQLAQLRWIDEFDSDTFTHTHTHTHTAAHTHTHTHTHTQAHTHTHTDTGADWQPDPPPQKSLCVRSGQINLRSLQSKNRGWPSGTSHDLLDHPTGRQWFILGTESSVTTQQQHKQGGPSNTMACRVSAGELPMKTERSTWSHPNTMRPMRLGQKKKYFRNCVEYSI